jgi:hypothetical protein
VDRYVGFTLIFLFGFVKLKLFFFYILLIFQLWQNLVYCHVWGGARLSGENNSHEMEYKEIK